MSKEQEEKSEKIKWILIKLASTLSVAEIEYNTIKPAIPFWFLTLGYEPFIASTIASLIAITGYLAVADSMAYLTHLFNCADCCTTIHFVKQLEIYAMQMVS